MKTGRHSLASLLAAARDDRADLILADLSTEQVRWAIDSGLGPWLRRCTVADPEAQASPHWPLIHAADLTSRLIVAEHRDATAEIIDDVAHHAPTLTLLKGISLGDSCYPAPHLRMMRDIDILVAEDALSTVQARMLELGYRPQSSYPEQFYETHHHIMPMFHPRRHVWVELHRGLIPPSSHAANDAVFAPDCIRSQLKPSSFQGHQVNHLSDDLQLVYLASHWAFGLNRERGLVGVLDVMRVLKTTEDLNRVLGWLEGSFAATYVYLLLSYLTSRGLAELPPTVLEELRVRQQALGHANLLALHNVIDRYVVEGRPFDWIVSERSFGIIWQALLSPGRPTRNLLRLGWNLLPSRKRLKRALGARA